MQPSGRAPDRRRQGTTSAGDRALESLAEKGADHTFPLVLSLAKKEELVHVMGEREPRRLSRQSYALRLLQYVRDEAHRFAQHYHHILRRKKTIE